MLLRNAAFAGMIGPALFALIVVVLSVAQYGFMVDLGWDLIGSSDVPWPSGLALGPLGWLQVLNFILFGLALTVFAVGLHRGVAARVRGTVIGPVLLVVAGVALVLAAFKTDPSLSGGPQSWHGLIHGLAFMPLVLSLVLSFLLLWWRLRRDPLWRGYDLYTIITAVLYVVLFFYPKDDSPGCTREVCVFRDNFEEFGKLDAEVIGISSDSVESHRSFAVKHDLSFTLLSDEAGNIRRLYGVPKTFGLFPGRVTYVIDREGVVRHVFASQLSVERHVQEALMALRSDFPKAGA